MYYKEILLTDRDYTNKRYEAERIVQKRWADQYLDFWFKNRTIPFRKPLYDLAIRHPKADWEVIINRLNQEQVEYTNLLDRSTCPVCGKNIVQLRFNYSEVNGCYSYINGSCSYGRTFYYKDTFLRLEMLTETLDKFVRDQFIANLRNIGPKGLPDIVGKKNNILHFVEVKDIEEKPSEEQLYWLNWLCRVGKGISYVIRVSR